MTSGSIHRIGLESNKVLENDNPHKDINLVRWERGGFFTQHKGLLISPFVNSALNLH